MQIFKFLLRIMVMLLQMELRCNQKICMLLVAITYKTRMSIMIQNFPSAYQNYAYLMSLVGSKKKRIIQFCPNAFQFVKLPRLHSEEVNWFTQLYTSKIYFDRHQQFYYFGLATLIFTHLKFGWSYHFYLFTYRYNRYILFLVSNIQ